MQRAPQDQQPTEPGWWLASDGKWYPPESAPNAVPSMPPPPGSHCGNCGRPVTLGAAACMNCGFAPKSSRNYCLNCGAALQPGQVICTNCGFAIGSGGSSVGSGPQEKSKVAAGVLAILLGGLGIHKFYLGYNTAGFVMLGVGVGAFCLSFVYIGIPIIFAMSVICVIEGITYLTKSDEQFHDTYVANKREWF